MSMQIQTTPFGESHDVHWGSDIESLNFSSEGLSIRIACAISPTKQVEGLEIHFSCATGFRYLDELDLARYWPSPSFSRGAHVLEVTSDGWSDEENSLQGFITKRKEWLIVTGNGCVSVFSTSEPTSRSVSWPAEHLA
jgi:hypothetical protein